MALSNHRKVFALAVFSAMPLLVACPKKDPPPVDAAPPPVPEVDAAPAVLVPLEEDAGEDADAAEAGKKFTGTPVNTNVARLKQCCAAIRKQAQGAPELTAAAASCDQLAANAGPSGNAPELGALRGLFGGRTIPPICAGF